MVKYTVGPTPTTRPSKEPLNTVRVDYSPIARAGQSIGSGLNTIAGALKQREESNKQTQRFDTLTNFTAWHTQTAQEIAAFEQTSPVDTANFVEQMDAKIETARARFMNDVPAELEDEFRYRTETVKQGLMGQALKFDLAQRDLYFSSKISERLETAKKELAQTPEALEAARNEIFEIIDASGLDAAKKLEQRKLAGAALTGISYKAAVMAERGKQLTTAQTTGNNTIAAADLPPVAGGVLNAIGKRESGNRYDIRYNGSAGGGKINSFADHPRQSSPGPRGRSSAAGKYMFIGSTWDIAARGAGVNDFTPASQDKAAWFWANRTAKVETGKTVEELIASGDLRSLKRAFETQWEGVKHMSLEEFTSIVNSGATIGDVTVTSEQFLDDPRFADLSYDQMIALAQDGVREADAAYAASVKQAEAYADAQRNQLYNNLFDGKAGASDIENARRSGVLTEFDDIKKAYGIIDKNENDTRRLREAQTMLEDGDSWVKGNDDHTARANALFGEDGAKALDEKNEDYVAQTLIPRWEKMEYAAPDMANQLLAMTRQADETKALFAFEALRQMRATRPEAFGAQFDNDIQRQLDMYEYGSNYWGEEGLVGRIQGRGLDQADRQARQALQKEGAEIFDKELVKGKNFSPSGFMSNSLGPLIGWDPNDPLSPAQSGTIFNQFRTLFIDNYSQLGDTEAARTMAAKQMSLVWGMSSIGGTKRLMQFPPQAAGYKPYEGSMDWIDTQVRDMFGWGSGVDFQLVPTEQTESEIAAYKNGSKKPPSYLVFYRDEQGFGRYATAPDTSEVRTVYFEWTPEMHAHQEAIFRLKQTAADEDFIRSEYRRITREQKNYDDAIKLNKELGFTGDIGPRPVLPKGYEEEYKRLEAEKAASEKQARDEFSRQTEGIAP